MAVTLFSSARFLTSAAKLTQLPAAGLPEIAFAGRSNAGKSTTINVLSNNSHLAFASKTPGRTQLINFFRLSFGADDAGFLVDLPGYGYSKASPETRAGWTELVAGYLNERPSLVGIVIVMDARRPFMPADEWLIDFFTEKTHVKQLWLLNKCDKLNRSERIKAQRLAETRAKALGDNITVQLFSGLKKEGREALSETLLNWIDPDGRFRTPLEPKK